MSQPSSFASLSSIDSSRQYRSTLRSGIWFVISLVAIDLTINVLFAYPKDPATPPSHFKAYFEYGRSTEGQLRRMTRPLRAQTAPITLAGWYEPLQVKEYASTSLHTETVTIYGASHAVNLARALE